MPTEKCLKIHVEKEGNGEQGNAWRINTSLGWVLHTIVGGILLKLLPLCSGGECARLLECSDNNYPKN